MVGGRLNIKNKRTISFLIVSNLQPPKFLAVSCCDKGGILKKVWLVYFVALMCGFPVFADNQVTGNGTECVYDTLNTYTGPATITANWRANIINLHWRNNNTEMQPSNTTANTCTYDGSITLPSSNPTRTGYTFTGWEVMPQMDFTTITRNTTGTDRFGIGSSSTNSDICKHAVGIEQAITEPCTNDDYGDLQRHEWKTIFGHGTTYGMIKCSAKSGNNHGTGWGGDSSDWRATESDLTSVSGDERYCWCKVTGYKPDGSDLLYSPIYELPYVYTYDYEIPRYCSEGCPGQCALATLYYNGFRAAAYGVSH